MATSPSEPKLFYSEGLPPGGLLYIYRGLRGSLPYLVVRLDQNGVRTEVGRYRDVEIALKAVDKEREEKR